MNIALYGESGFYATTGRAGRRGDFITSAEVGPLFGAVLARAVDNVWNTLGQPDNFHIVEVGAGPGTLARSILAAQPKCLSQGEYIAVEI
ncbi:MAG: class I SAM-dependent methyltransferase, partial [Actinobacteria bacterium]|nr:class I SAM-dependent methyltransferase [Actinomycetota bacterium]